MVLTSFTSMFVFQGNDFVLTQGCICLFFIDRYDGLQIHLATKGWFCITHIGKEHDNGGLKKISLLNSVEQADCPPWLLKIHVGGDTSL